MEFDYHQKRRIFIIFPNAGIFWAEQGTGENYTELMDRMSIPKYRQDYILAHYPRGYFYNNNLVIYEGLNVREGEAWQLSEKNYPHLGAVFPDMQKILPLTDKTKIFLGVKRGKIGEEWENFNQIDLDFFKKWSKKDIFSLPLNG